MDLTSWLLQRTVPRPFVVTGLGGTAARLGVEREMRERGWPQALSPAAANLLLFCGTDASNLGAVVDRVWDQLPQPRARAELPTPEDLGPVLDRAAEQLTNVHRQCANVDPPDLGHGHDAGKTADADVPSAAVGDTGGHGTLHAGHAGMHSSDAGPHGSHVGLHGSDMDMELPGGLLMADRGPDRDGLILDRLHVPLGPALPDWPPGLLLRLVLQGDVVQEVTVEVIGSAAGSYWDASPTIPARHWQAAATLDSLQRLLSVAGWPAAAMTARRLRDDLLTGVTPESIGTVWSSWDRRVRRSRTLRWSTDRLGARRDGDVTARVVCWLDIAAAAWTGHRPPRVPERSSAAEKVLADLPRLLVGQELAAVRLVVASLDPDLEALTRGAPPTPEVHSD